MMIATGTAETFAASAFAPPRDATLSPHVAHHFVVHFSTDGPGVYECLGHAVLAYPIWEALYRQADSSALNVRLLKGL